MADQMTCFAGEREPTHECPGCCRPFCEDHGEELCDACLEPAGGVPSFTLYRGSLLALLIGTALAVWLLIQPSGSEGEGGIQPVVITPTTTLATGTQTPGATQPAVQTQPPGATTTPAAGGTRTAAPRPPARLPPPPPPPRRPAGAGRHGRVPRRLRRHAVRDLRAPEARLHDRPRLHRPRRRAQQPRRRERHSAGPEAPDTEMSGWVRGGRPNA